MGDLATMRFRAAVISVSDGYRKLSSYRRKKVFCPFPLSITRTNLLYSPERSSILRICVGVSIFLVLQSSASHIFSKHCSLLSPG